VSIAGEPDRAVQRRVGRYAIGQEVGRGGMAAVYVARQLDLDRTVALKELRVFRSAEASFAQRFLREARLAGSFSHPNIVTVHEYFEFEGLPYIAMEYLSRGSLRRHVGRVSLAQAGGVLEGVLAGLTHAERQRVVHRDIKPENLLVTVDGAVKIADFGIAKATTAVETGALLTATGMTVGTPNYIAPEQAMAHELGPWTDLYSLGLTTFELFAGRAPFADTQEPMAIVLRQLNEHVPPLRDLVPHVDPSLSEWVGWLASKSPADRPHSAAQAWDALEEILIARLGPRWRHGAQLLEPGERPGAALPERPTRRQIDPRVAATVPPRRPLVEAAPAPARARRFPRSLKLTAAVVALVVTGLALAGRQVAPTTTSVTPVQQDAATSTSLSRPSTDRAQTTAATTAPESAGNAALLADRVAPAQKLARDNAGAADRIAKRSSGSSSDAQLVSALRRVARDYRAAAAAATRGDLAGYTDAITAANAGAKTVAGKLDAPSPSTPKVTQPQAPTRSASTEPAPTQPAPTQPAPGPCSGDSASDDPSDDECGE